MLKIALICCFILLSDVDAFARRDVTSQAQPNLFADLQRNLDHFRNCVDQSLASMVGQVQEKQLQPILNVVGDTVNKVSKAFDDLTATTRPAAQTWN